MSDYYRKIIYGLILVSFLLGKSFLAQKTVEEISDFKWIILKTIDGQYTPSGPIQEAIAIDLDDEGSLYILDRGLNRLLKFTENGLFLKEIGGFGNGPEQFDDPRDVDAHLTLNVYVADYNNNRIVRYDSNLNFLNEFRPSFDSPSYFEFPLSIAVNGQYDIFLLEDINKSVLKFNRFNQPLATFGRSSENLGQLLGPYQLTNGSKNEIYISDPLKKSILVFDYLGNFLREISHPNFIEPKGISVSQRKELVVVDEGSQQIYFFENGMKFSEKIDMRFLNIKPLDVVLWQPRGATKKLLFVSTSQKCYILTEK